MSELFKFKQERISEIVKLKSELFFMVVGHLDSTVNNLFRSYFLPRQSLHGYVLLEEMKKFLFRYHKIYKPYDNFDELTTEFLEKSVENDFNDYKLKKNLKLNQLTILEYLDFIIYLKNELNYNIPNKLGCIDLEEIRIFFIEV